MLRCREVTELVGTEALAGGTLRQRLGVRLHLLMCRHCRAYVRSLRRIAAAARRMSLDEPPLAASRVEGVMAAIRRQRASPGKGDGDTR